MVAQDTHSYEYASHYMSANFLVVQCPDDVGPPMLAVSPGPSPASRDEGNFLKPGDLAVPQLSPSPRTSLVPPPLRRQNASRFSWPPDAQQAWCYIVLSPEEFVHQASSLLGIELNVHQVRSPMVCSSPLFLAFSPC